MDAKRLRSLKYVSSASIISISLCSASVTALTGRRFLLVQQTALESVCTMRGAAYQDARGPGLMNPFLTS